MEELNSRSNYVPEDINVKHRQSLGKHDKVAVILTSALGTMYAVYLILVVVGGWMVWQLLVEKPIDPFPFAFMVFISNIFQLLLIPLLMVGQNVQGKHARMRAEEEYKATKAIRKDIEEVLRRLEKR